MNIIAAADKNWGIGKNNELLANIPEDMKFFREKTMGKVVIMGKNTFLSFPGPKALPKRVNIVLTHDENFNYENIIVCKSIDEAINEAKKYCSDEDIFFIGGEQIYKKAVDYCDTAFITKIDNEYDADRFLVDFDSLDDWDLKDENMIKTECGEYITFSTYLKKKQ